MATNRDIVATRKLNKENKARLGRRGDTKIREVGGRDSHVNALEAYLIDVNNKAGEDYAKRVGAGTTNPLTGMPEYHWKASWKHMANHAKEEAKKLSNPYEAIKGIVEDIGESAAGKTFKAFVSGGVGGGDYEESGPTMGKKDYDELAAMTPEELEDYLQTEFDIGEDSMQYIEGFQEEPLGFLGEQQALTEKGLQSAYGATMGKLGSEQKMLGIQGEGLTAQQTALGRTTGRGLSKATGAASMAASRSGFARSGTITSGLEAQKKQLFQDYTAGTQDIGRQRAGIAVGMEGISRGRQEALGTLTLGQEGADLDFRQGEYIEKKRQLDELYADVAAVSTATASDKRLKENVDYVGDSPSGIKMYEFNYLNNDTRHRGVMADDLVDSHPEVLSKDEDGYYMVDYSKIDVNFEIVKGD